MLISNDLRKKNVSEYILYMFHVEDIIRGFDFDINKIDQYVIQKHKVNDSTKKEILNWYSNLIELLNKPDIRNKGHIFLLDHLINDLEDFHLRLMASEDNEYREKYSDVFIFIEPFLNQETKPILLSINVMYWYLIQKLSNKVIEEKKLAEITKISKLLAHLSMRYHEFENGIFEL